MFGRSLNRIANWFQRRGPSYAARLIAEQSAFKDTENVHDLPGIFHYWSNKYLLPMFEPFGFNSPNDFFRTSLAHICAASADEPVRIASIGAGNCDLEIQLAAQLRASAAGDFHIECIDLNPDMLARGQRAAQQAGVQALVSFTEADFNFWEPGAETCDAVMANQSLHHVLDLEHLFSSIKVGLKPAGRFLISDMIGRNGHMRWPEALHLVDEFWQELPAEYRYNRLMQRLEKEYINHDCSTYGFEGIRAQDILGLLTEQFSFELFIPYGNIIFPFVDRAFGHNFDPQAEWDRDFIDRVHAADEAAMIAGTISPASMVASVVKFAAEPRLRHPRLTPKACIRRP